MAKEEPPTFASLLYDYLEAEGIGVTELARRLTGARHPDRKAIDARRRPLQRYLKGKHEPRAATRTKIIKALGLPPDAFDAAFQPGSRARRQDQIDQIRRLVDEIAQALGKPSSPQKKTIHGLLAELATKLAIVEEANTKATQDLGTLRTRVERLEARHEPGAGEPTDRNSRRPPNSG